MTLLEYSTPTSDAVAFVEIAMAVVLLVGMFVVRRGHVRIHRILQSSVILVNIPIVLIWMVPQYTKYVLPGIPGEIGEPYYYAPTLMLVVGLLAELLGIFIILVAATDWVPERYRFRRYKLWMRTELALWWGVVFAGLATYYVWGTGIGS